MAATRLARQARGPGRRVSRGVRGGVGNRRARPERNAKAPARNGAQRGMGLEPTGGNQDRGAMAAAFPSPSADRIAGAGAKYPQENNRIVGKEMTRGGVQTGRRGGQANQQRLRGQAQAGQDRGAMAAAFPQEQAAPAARAKKVIPNKTRKALGG